MEVSGTLKTNFSLNLCCQRIYKELCYLVFVSLCIVYACQCANLLFRYTKVKVKYLWVPFGGASHLGEHIFHGPQAELWHYAAVRRTLSYTSFVLLGSYQHHR